MSAGVSASGSIARDSELVEITNEALLLACLRSEHRLLLVVVKLSLSSLAGPSGSCNGVSRARLQIRLSPWPWLWPAMYRNVHRQ